MKEYTYNELVAMQEEAKQRVMEMQKKSKYALDDINRSFGGNSKNVKNDKEKKEHEMFSYHTVPIAQQPKNIQYPTGLVNSENEKHNNAYAKNTDDKVSNKSSGKRTQEKNDAMSNFFNIFGKLSREESEKMLVLALCMLLSNEQADENLIMALLYLIV